MSAFLDASMSTGLTTLSSGSEHCARSPFSDGLMSGTHLDGLLAAGLVLVFMTVALLKPEWMG